MAKKKIEIIDFLDGDKHKQQRLPFKLEVKTFHGFTGDREVVVQFMEQRYKDSRYYKEDGPPTILRVNDLHNVTMTFGLMSMVCYDSGKFKNKGAGWNYVFKPNITKVEFSKRVRGHMEDNGTLHLWQIVYVFYDTESKEGL